MPTLRVDQYLAITIICVLLLLPIIPIKPLITPRIPYLQPLTPIPITDQTSLIREEFVATLSAKSALVIDVPSAAILLTKNSEEQVPPASTTKMVTALVARDIYNLDDVVTIKAEAFTLGHTVGFTVNEQFTVRSLLTSLLVSSGNDAALALANHHPQGYEGFVAAMNQKAKELHLSHSSFRNPSGLDENDHFSTARDLGVVARALMLDPVLKPLVATKQTVIKDVTGKHAHWLYNTNDLLHTEPGVIGIKTGTTELAKENVVTEVERNGHQLLIVVLGSEDRYGDTKQLLNWTERHYQWVQPDLSTLHLVEPL